MIRGCLVLLLSGSANGCFGIGGGARSAKPPAPADYVARGLPPPPADLEAELERFANAIEGDAAMKASGVPESRERADALLQNLAAQSQSRLERPLPLDTVVAYFRAAADSMGQRHEVQELGGEHAMGRQNIQRSRPVQQMLFQAFYTALLGGAIVLTR